MSHPFAQRHLRLTELLIRNDLTAAAFNPGPTLSYLTGLHFHLMERPIVLLFAPQRDPALVLPELETPKLDAVPFPVQAFPYGENPAQWHEAFRQAVQALDLDGGRVAMEPTRLRVLELRYLEDAAPRAECVPAADALSDLRICKTAQEVDAMRQAVRIAERALDAALAQVRPGMTERDLAAELTVQLLRHGSDPTLPFRPIISGGPNSANPHATPTDRPLQAGDLLLIDWGASVHGYVSDLTRVFALGEVDPELVKISEIVYAANQAGREAARPGLPAGEIDRAARQVIVTKGYGRFFTHRTGHGLGLEGHEPPFLFPENTRRLKAGMAFTVEPGIYLPGKGGVRIEDDVVVTPDGAETLSTLPRSLRRLW